MNLITNIPEEILIHVISFLPSEDRVGVCTVGKLFLDCAIGAMTNSFRSLTHRGKSVAVSDISKTIDFIDDSQNVKYLPEDIRFLKQITSDYHLVMRLKHKIFTHTSYFGILTHPLVIDKILPMLSINNERMFSSACLTGNIPAIDISVSYGAKRYNNGLCYALIYGHITAVKHIWENYKTTVESKQLMFCACSGGNIECIDFVMKICYNRGFVKYPLWDKGIAAIIMSDERISPECKALYLPLVNNGLYGACLRGHINVAEIMIFLGANDFMGAWYNVHFSGDLRMFHWMCGIYELDSGSFALYKFLTMCNDADAKYTYLDSLLPADIVDPDHINIIKFAYRDACGNGYLFLVKYMIDKKILSPSLDGFIEACASRKLDVIKYLVTFHHDSIHDGINTAIKEGNINIAEYLISYDAINRYKQMAVILEAQGNTRASQKYARKISKLEQFMDTLY